MVGPERIGEIDLRLDIEARKGAVRIARAVTAVAAHAILERRPGGKREAAGTGGWWLGLAIGKGRVASRIHVRHGEQEGGDGPDLVIA